MRTQRRLPALKLVKRQLRTHRHLLQSSPHNRFSRHSRYSRYGQHSQFSRYGQLRQPRPPIQYSSGPPFRQLISNLRFLPLHQSLRLLPRASSLQGRASRLMVRLALRSRKLRRVLGPFSRSGQHHRRLQQTQARRIRQRPGPPFRSAAHFPPRPRRHRRRQLRLLFLQSDRRFRRLAARAQRIHLRQCHACRPAARTEMATPRRRSRRLCPSRRRPLQTFASTCQWRS